MNILLNFIPIKKGGGQQVATAFIKTIKEIGTDMQFTFLVTAGTFAANLLADYKFDNVILVKNSKRSRLLFELFSLKKIIKAHKIDGIFTMFGPDLPKSGVPSIVGCAYSNIFFPEIDFWGAASFYKKKVFELIDSFRLKRTLQADGIIFENKAMQSQAEKLYEYPLNKTVFIKPSILPLNAFDSPSSEYLKQTEKIPGVFNALILSGWHKNKNINQVPFILSELKKLGITNISFVITVPPLHPESVTLMNTATALGVAGNIHLIGPVLPTDIRFLYEKIDTVLLLSLLESFSNNIIESWTYSKPLVISDLEWAKSICNEAAVFVDRNNAVEIALQIKKLYEDKEWYKKMQENGRKELATYPSAEQKVLSQLEFVKKIIHEAGH
ncbi:MAG: glycosyltransferase [Mucilaginibacter sp.]